MTRLTIKTANEQLAKEGIYRVEKSNSRYLIISNEFNSTLVSARTLTELMSESVLSYAAETLDAVRAYRDKAVAQTVDEEVVSPEADQTDDFNTWVGFPTEPVTHQQFEWQKAQQELNQHLETQAENLAPEPTTTLNPEPVTNLKATGLTYTANGSLGYNVVNVTPLYVNPVLTLEQANEFIYENYPGYAILRRSNAGTVSYWLVNSEGVNLIFNNSLQRLMKQVPAVVEAAKEQTPNRKLVLQKLLDGDAFTDHEKGIIGRAFDLIDLVP